MDHRIKFLPLVFGVVIAMLGVKEWRLALTAKPTPQTLTASQLVKEGPGTNAHILLTGYAPVGEQIVYQEKSKGGPWQCVWLPLQPMGFLGLAPGGPVRILFKTKKASNENELNQIFMGGGPLRGMIVNKVESLGSEEKKHLTQGYPGIDFDKCYIFEHERHPAGTTQVVGMMGGGGFLFLIGLAWFTAGWQKNR